MTTSIEAPPTQNETIVQLHGDGAQSDHATTVIVPFLGSALENALCASYVEERDEPALGRGDPTARRLVPLEHQVPPSLADDISPYLSYKDMVDCPELPNRFASNLLLYMVFRHIKPYRRIFPRMKVLATKSWMRRCPRAKG